MVGVSVRFALALLLGACGPSADGLHVGALPETVDFNFHVKPILSDRCFKCHGPDSKARKADLRFDTEDGFRRVVSSGGLWPSELVQRVTSKDPDEVMPPTDSHLTLSSYEIAILARWVEQGAEYKKHWSFLPPTRAAPPAVSDAGWAKSPIDRFILARLDAATLKPSPEADRERLIRRVTFDLTGLPPSVDDVERFVADRSAHAYEKVVDRLLASPRYGERMASDWLDLARYADSHGYQDDGARQMWRWRDWVIGAFNRNQRYDEFVTWQLAGDLLPNATRDQILATAFNRNHPQTAEGGVVEEEFRVEYVADRTNTFGRAFLGLSMDCARCHDHKYDPLPQKDYYRLFAFFNSIDEKGLIVLDGNAGPTLTLLKAEEERELATIRAYMAQREGDLQRYVQTARPSARVRLPDLARGLVGHFPLDTIVADKFANRVKGAKPVNVGGETRTGPGKIGNALAVTRTPDIAQAGGVYRFDRTDPFSLSVWVHLGKKVDYAPILTRAASFTHGHRGYELSIKGDRLFATLTHLRPTDEIRLLSRAALPLNRWTHLTMTYDGSSSAQGLRVYVDGRPAAMQVEADALRRTIDVENVAFQIGGQASVDIRALEDARIDEVRVYDRTLTRVEAEQLAGLGTIDSLRTKPASAWTAEQQTELAALTLRETELAALTLREHDAGYAARAASLRESRKRENELLSKAEDVMVMQELRTPRPSYVLDRGAYDAPRERVMPGTPASVLAYPASYPQNRLGLARWLFAPEHPLTARVAVNRHWQMLFGTGLVKSSDDFGAQGEIPSHPELLDWLAITFRDSGWNVKALMKTMVMSATYRQSSRPRPEVLARDPENRLLARGPSHRLTAEMVRDGALAASGLLHDSIGGPSVKPYQPDGLWEEKSAGRGALAKYVQDSGSALHRRGMYTFWKRSSPPPTMTTFDAAERGVCTVTRQRTNTPLQALVLMNDPQYVEASRVLAERMMRDGGADVDARIRLGARAVLSRAPDEQEMRVLRSLHDRELARFRGDGGAANSLLSVGARARDSRAAPAELAALTVVASTLLNLDEAVTKR